MLDGAGIVRPGQPVRPRDLGGRSELPAGTARVVVHAGEVRGPATIENIYIYIYIPAALFLLLPPPLPPLPLPPLPLPPLPPLLLLLLLLLLLWSLQACSGVGMMMPWLWSFDDVSSSHLRDAYDLNVLSKLH
jgi:hypothetical protein